MPSKRVRDYKREYATYGRAYAIKHRDAKTSWYYRNKKKAVKQQVEYGRKHKKQRREICNRWYSKHKNEVLKRCRERYRKDINKIRKINQKKQRKLYWKSPAKHRAKQRYWYHKNPEIYRISVGWSRFRRMNGVKNTKEGKEHYAWLRLARKEFQRILKLEREGATSEKKLRQLSRQLESRMRLKSSIKMQQA